MPEGPGPQGPGPDDEVGSLGRELAELLRTMAVQSRTDRAHGTPDHDLDDEPSAEAGGPPPHRCPHGWCPLCQAVELVQEHPEVASAVLDSAMAFARSVRDAFDLLLERQRTEGGAS